MLVTDPQRVSVVLHPDPVHHLPSALSQSVVHLCRQVLHSLCIRLKQGQLVLHRALVIFGSHVRCDAVHRVFSRDEVLHKLLGFFVYGIATRFFRELGAALSFAPGFLGFPF